MNKNFIIHFKSEPLFIPHNHDGTYPGYGVFSNFSAPLWPCVIRDYLDRNFKFKKFTHICIDIKSWMSWNGKKNQLYAKRDSIVLVYRHLLYIDKKPHIKNTLNQIHQIVCLIDYTINNMKLIQNNQNYQIDTEDTILSISEESMIKILNIKKNQDNVSLFFLHTPKYPYVNYQSNHGHNFETDSLVSCYFQNDSIHLVNKRTSKLFYKTDKICQLLKVGHYDYIFTLDFESKIVYNYNAKMDKLMILKSSENCNYYISSYLDSSNNIFRLSSANNTDYKNDYFVLNKYYYNVTWIDYIITDYIQGPVYKRNVIYDEYLKKLPRSNKSYSYLFLFFAIPTLLTFIFYFIKINIKN